MKYFRGRVIPAIKINNYLLYNYNYMLQKYNNYVIIVSDLYSKYFSYSYSV